MLHSLPNLPCYLNGQYTLLPDAKVSVMDRSFIFGDGVYEFVPIYNGRPFRFEDHLSRLDRSLAATSIELPYTRADWSAIAKTLLDNYQSTIGADDTSGSQMIYLQVSRGVAMRDHVMPLGLPPTVFAYVNQLKLPSPQLVASGATCVTADDFRWQKAHIKSTSLQGAVFARQISFDAGGLETVMFRDGYLSEAASSNVWVVKGGEVFGTTPDNLVLQGIRYGLIAELCAQQGIPFSLRRVTRQEVLGADELILSSASKEVLAITTLDEHPVGSGVPGPVFKSLYAGYQAAKTPA